MKPLNQNFIIVLITIVVASIVVYFLYQKYTSTTPNQNIEPSSFISVTSNNGVNSNLAEVFGTEKKAQSHIQTETAYYLSQLSQADSDNELLAKIKDFLLVDETAVLHTLKSLDFDKYSGRRVGTLLIEHFSQYSDIFDTIDKLTMFENSEAHFLYENVSAGLLASHSSHLDTDSVITFLSEQKNSVIALKASPDVGRQMIEDKSDKAFVVDNIANMPDIENKESLLYGALEQWLKQEPDNLLEYLSLHEHRTAFDRVVSQYVFQYKDQNPENVMPLALAIKDDEQRFTAVYGTAQELARHSPKVYLSFIDTVTNAELKARIIEAVGEIN